MPPISDFLNTLPFLLAILVEIAILPVQNKYKNIFEQYANAEDWFADEWEEVLERELSSIDESDRIINNVERAQHVHLHRIKADTKDYAQYSSQWVQTKLTIFLTLISAHGVTYASLLPNIQNREIVELVFYVLLVYTTTLFLLYILVDDWFEDMDPHENAASRQFWKYSISLGSISIITINGLTVLLIVVYSLIA